MVGSINITSVNEFLLNNSNVEVSPNPTTDKINMNSKVELYPNQIKLKDITGKEINITHLTHKVSSNHYEIDCSELNNGIYFINYFNSIKKIIILK